MLVPNGYEDEIKCHDELFSGSSWEIGKIHWYIQKADTEMDSRCEIRKKGEHSNVLLEVTPFGEEVGTDEINWWVYRRETEVEELRKKTEVVLSSAQKLKEDSFALKSKSAPKSYSDLIRKIHNFTKDHKKEIHDLYDYVLWLHEKDVLAPRILFAYRVWGSTRLSERVIRITANTIDEDHETVKKCVEVALGLRIDQIYTIGTVYSDIFYEIAESLDDEYPGPIPVPPKQRVLGRTFHRVLSELATYFEFLRQSLRNIILDIEKYNDQMKLLYRESFWKSFIMKAMSSNRIENQLWDFKATLEMWHPRHREREKAEFKFCEQIASFANTNGGVLIIGVTDEPPRRILGVQDMENRIKDAKNVLRRHVNYNTGFTHCQQIPMKDEDGRDKSCLAIAVAQTKDVISVKDQTGKISCPIRTETGLERSSYEKIKDSKKNIPSDNYRFILNLYTFLHDQ
ncbi:ATP-binding protein [Candidatus Bathyarchaeota archaeon]|nr:ATP-binding protein [Candidatus Bathyarchaeota archaeon]